MQFHIDTNDDNTNYWMWQEYLIDRHYAQSISAYSADIVTPCANAASRPGCCVQGKSEDTALC